MNARGNIIVCFIFLAAATGCKAENDARAGSESALTNRSDIPRSDRVQIVVSKSGSATIYIGETAVAIASDFALMPEVAKELEVVAPSKSISDGPNSWKFNVACGEGLGCADVGRPLPLPPVPTPSPTPIPVPGTSGCILGGRLCIIPHHPR